MNTFTVLHSCLNVCKIGNRKKRRMTASYVVFFSCLTTVLLVCLCWFPIWFVCIVLIVVYWQHFDFDCFASSAAVDVGLFSSVKLIVAPGLEKTIKSTRKKQKDKQFKYRNTTIIMHCIYWSAYWFSCFLRFYGCLPACCSWPCWLTVFLDIKR